LQRNGTLGLIATNTVAQGDSREVGLDAIVAAGFTITRAIQSRSWPSASAHLEFAAVWGTRADVAAEVPRIADGIEVRLISTLLEPAGRATGNPIRLGENAGMAFQGCIVLGMGFVIEEEEAQEWIAADARNADVLFPYLNGEDLNSRPDSSASRWVIDFNDWDEARAARYSLPYDRAAKMIKPERQRRKPDGSYALRNPLPERWWQYAEKRPAMRNAIADLGEVLVVGLVSKTVMPVRVPSQQVFSHKVGVFATDSYAMQAILSSGIHWLWAVKYGSTLETRVNYSPSDVFETFPIPPLTEALEAAGRELDAVRRDIMRRLGLGITKLYNLVNDPTVNDLDAVTLRNIHVQVEEIVLTAFGWADIDLDYGFHTYRRMERWLLGPSAQTEVLDRLLEENRRRSWGRGGQPPAAKDSAAQQASGTLYE